MLIELPPEVFDLVIQKLTKADLKALSRVSKYVHAIVIRTLWRSITIKPPSEFSLHGVSAAALEIIPLEFATQLQFCSEFQYATLRRCPHLLDYSSIQWDTQPYGSDDGESSDAEDKVDEETEEPRFGFLNNNARMLLGRLEKGQLHDFGWNLGTCISPEILGADGIISRMHPLIRSLSLTTDSNCRLFSDSGGCDIDLSRFHQLRSLSWKAPNPENMSTISVAIRRNSPHLQKLELDLVNWPRLWADLASSIVDIDEDGFEAQNFFVGKVLGQNESSTRPLLPAIRVLSLTQIPLLASLAYAINFDTLVSLTLRMCPGMNNFLERVVQLRFPIKLKTLEFHATDSILGEICNETIAHFLDAFEGLEELFIYQSHPLSTLSLWEIISVRHTTLKRFVHHQRGLEIDELDHSEEEFNVQDRSITGRNIHRLKNDPLQNPLTRLDLEFIGLACLPEGVKYLLLPFKAKTSLKVLHIRQSVSDLERFPSWTVSHSPVLAPSDRRSPVTMDIGHVVDMDDYMDIDGFMINDMFSCSDADSPISETRGFATGSGVTEAVAGRYQAPRVPKLRKKFRPFVDWAFGPEGIASLQMIIFGDFAYGGRAGAENNCLYGRCTDGTSNYRIVGRYETAWKEVRDTYHNAIEACPSEPLFM